MHGVEPGDELDGAAARLPRRRRRHRHHQPGDRLDGDRRRPAGARRDGARASTPPSARSGSPPASPRSGRSSSRGSPRELATSLPAGPVGLRRGGRLGRRPSQAAASARRRSSSDQRDRAPRTSAFVTALQRDPPDRRRWSPSSAAILGLLLVRQRDFAAEPAPPESRPRSRSPRSPRRGGESVPARAASNRGRAARAADREPAADRAGRAAPRRGPERDHRRDRGRQDGPRPLARPADGRQGAAADRPARAPTRPRSRASSTLPDGLLDDPELAELAERLPDGRRARSCSGGGSAASGRTSAFVGGRSARRRPTCGRSASRLLAFYGQHEHRKLTLASAQLEILDGFAGAEHLERRRAYRAAHAEVARAASASWPSCASATGARERDLDLLRYELAEIEGAAPDPGEEAELAAERERLRHAEGLRDAAAGARWRAIAGAEESDGAARRRARRRPRRCWRASAGSIRRSTRWPSGSARWRSSSTTSPASCAPTSTGSRPIPGGSRQVEERLDALDRLKRKHGGASSRCSPTPSAAGRRSSGSRAPRSAAPSSRRRWPRPPSARGELGAELTEAAARGGRGALGERGRRRARASWRWTGATLEVVLEPHPDGFGPSGARDGRAAGRDQPRDRRRRRFATPPRAASSRG